MMVKQSYVETLSVNFLFLIAFSLSVSQWAQAVGKHQKCCQNGKERTTDRCLQPALCEQSKWSWWVDLNCLHWLTHSFISACLFHYFFVICRGLKALNQLRRWLSRLKLSKLKRSPKKSSQKSWMRYWSKMLLTDVFLFALYVYNSCVAFHRVRPSTPSRCWRKVTRQTFQRKARLWAAGTLVPWRMELSSTPISPHVWLNLTPYIHTPPKITIVTKCSSSTHNVCFICCFFNPHPI